MKYQSDALCLAIYEIAALFPHMRIGYFTCPECHTKKRFMYLHPSERYRWACKDCLQLKPSYRPEANLQRLAQGRAHVETVVYNALVSHTSPDVPQGNSLGTADTPSSDAGTRTTSPRRRKRPTPS